MNKENKLIPDLRFPEFEKDGEWAKITIKSVGEILTGGTPSKEENEYWGGDFVWVTAQDFKKKYIYDSVLKLTKKGKEKSRIIPKNSVLVTCIASIGLNGINKVECATNQQINSIVCNSLNYYEFVYYAISKNITRLKNMAGQTAVPIISKSIFEKFTIQKPLKFEEQQKIASCLSSLDELIDAHKDKLNALKDHKKGLMQNLFPQDGETVPKYRFPEFKNDANWAEKKLGDCLLQKPEYGINAPAVIYSDKLPKYLRITDISEDGNLLSNNKVSVDRNVTENNYLSDGDIVLARTGASVGKSYKFREKDGKLVFAGFLIRVRPDISKLDSELLFQFLSTPQYWQWVKFISARSGQPGINGNEYASMPISLPPTINEQNKIATCLSILDELINTQTKEIEQLQKHKKGLMQGLFPKN